MLAEEQQQAKIFDVIQHLESGHIVNVLKKRFEIERISRYFKVIDYRFKGPLLAIDGGNSIMMEFPTLQKEFPDDYASSSYKLLLLLCLRSEKLFNDDLKLEIQNISRKDNVDQIIIWSCEQIQASIVQSLKNINTDIVYIRPEEFEKLKSISHFIPTIQRDYDYAVAVNTISDLLLKRLKKLFHLVLSEVAAPIYNRLYGKTKVATAAMMQFEETLIQSLINQMGSKGGTGKAVDVGCGTGRHSFPLAKHFKEVYAFDFSPRMIEQAELEKQRQNITNIFFSVADLEYEEIIDERAFYQSADLVIASFGLASFIEDTTQMLRRFYNWMKEDAYLMMSFYNSQSLILQVTPNWRDTSLSAHLDVENNTLRVELGPNSIFYIFCKPFSKVVHGAINSVFEIEAIYTYPTLMSLMPNDLLEHPLAKDLFNYLDKHISNHPDFSLGYYVTVVARKGKVNLEGFNRIKALLDRQNCVYELIDHLPVLSIEDVRRELGDETRPMVKTVIFQDRPANKLITVSLLAEKRVRKEQVAEALGVNKSRVVYSPEKEVLKLGFPLGGIAPFGFDESLEIQSFVDAEIDHLTEQWLYTGAGDNRKTLKLRRSDLLRLVEGYRRLKL